MDQYRKVMVAEYIRELILKYATLLGVPVLIAKWTPAGSGLDRRAAA
jgi:hypothetical protein